MRAEGLERRQGDAAPHWPDAYRLGYLNPPPVYIRAISAAVSHAARLRIAATEEVDALLQIPAVGAETSCRKFRTLPFDARHGPRQSFYVASIG